MELKDYLRVLRSRWRLITACVLVAVSAATFGSLLTKPVYQSDAKFFIRAANSDGSVGNAYTGSLFTQQRVKSYREFIASPTVTAAIVERLGIPGLTAEEIAGKLSADANLDTVNLNIHGRDGDPVRAQRITQAAAEVFRDYVGRLEGSATAVSPVALEIVLPAGPGRQIAPRTRLNIALGTLVGLAIGVGVAVAREVLDTRVTSPADMDDRFKLPTLAVVGFDPDAKSRPLIVQDDPRSSRAEAFRRLRTNLQFIDVDRSPRSFVVTSAMEGEGKTTTSCNLAIALASAGIPVVLIDGDLRRPSVAKYLGIEGSVGLTNVLIGQVPLADALQSWGTTGMLRVLPSGVLPPNPSELLGSQHMEDLISTLEADAILVIDAPPLLPVTDGAVLAASASGALIVVRLGRTRREQVSHAIESLHSVGAQVLGSVLNMARTKGQDAYNYGYGYYGDYAASLPDVVVPSAARRVGTTSGAAMAAPEQTAVSGETQPLPQPEEAPLGFRAADYFPEAR